MKKRLICGLVSAVLFLGACSRGEALVLSFSESEEAAETASRSAEEAEPEEPAAICVYICGAVKRPNVYTLPEGSRVYQAVEAAGGFTEEAEVKALNLAEVLADGRQITVFSKEEIESGRAAPASAGEVSDGKVDLNRATKEELQSLPGIGAVKAEAILRYREEAGGFSDIESIREISGIGEKSFERLRNLIKV